MKVLTYVLVGILAILIISTCYSNIKLYKGWTSYNVKTGTLNGFQPDGTMDIYSITLKAEAISYLKNLAHTLSKNRQYFIEAQGELIPDNDNKSPDGEFIIHRILYLGDKKKK